MHRIQTLTSTSTLTSDLKHVLANGWRLLRSGLKQASRRTMTYRLMDVNFRLVLGLCALFLLFCYVFHGDHEGDKWRMWRYDADEISERVKATVLDKDDKFNATLAGATVEVMGQQVFYVDVDPRGNLSKPSGNTVFLLHGAQCTNQIWLENTPTIQTLTLLGHRVIAIDMPGYGKSSAPLFKDDKARADFLKALFEKLCPGVKPIVVAPSMAGSYALPLLMNNQELFCAFVPIAPVSTGHFTTEQYAGVHVPTMIVVGEKDIGLGTTSTKALTQIPTATAPQVFKNLGHGCYLEDPATWLRLMANFLKRVDCL